MLPTEYRAYLEANLNLVERISQSFSSLDERIDYTNILLTKLLVLQGGAPPAPPAPPDWMDTLIATLNKLSLSLSNLTGMGIINTNSFITGQKTVITAGTAVELTTSSISIPNEFALTIIAKPGNTGYIYIGRAKGDAEGSQKFDGLSAGLAVSLRINNVNLVWINSSVDGDGVSWLVERNE